VGVVRDGALEALHCGHIAVVDADGDLLAGAGVADTAIYPRSALKPFQAAACLDLADDLPPAADELAMIAASHTGSRTHQAVVLRLLERAGVAPSALRCPHTLPTDAAALRERPAPTRLAHACSGKHAGFLLATRRADAELERYLAEDSPVQQEVLRRVRNACDTEPEGPAVDGCGAPAWRLPLVALARGYARVAAEEGLLGPVAEAMRTYPNLVGGQGLVDTELMAADGRITAKRGAEAALGIAVRDRGRTLGVAIKITDGGARAMGPVAGSVLTRLGVRVPPALARPAVLGGGLPHGALEVTSALREALDGLA
jgi:L-asparaginase II